MNDSELVKFKNESLELDVQVSPSEDTVWLNKEQMTKLFDRDRSVISRHIKHIFDEEELDEKSNVHFLHIANSDKPVPFYSLDVIISVGYRVKSKNGVIFRRWATKVLKEFLIKGYVVSSHRTLVTNENYINLIKEVNALKSDVAEIKRVLDSKSMNSFVCYEGQYYDGFAFINSLICYAKKRVIIIDGYADSGVLDFFLGSRKGIVKIVLCHKTERIESAALERFIKEYGEITIKEDKTYHDRFLIVDDDIYLLGSSLNSLGKKTSTITKTDEYKIEDFYQDE
ncbi:MAG: virulence RhuM family protein [Bacilli bacterium]|nr:virulence RhuM family protein [Bacilli bacterium]